MPLITTIVWPLVNARERRVRAGLRVFAQLVLLSLATLLFGALFHLFDVVGRALFPAAHGWFGALRAAPSPQWLLFATSMCLRITVSVWIARRFIDRRSFASLGVGWDKAAGHDLFLGVLVGGLIQSVVFGIEWLAGWLQIAGLGFAPRSAALFAWSAATMCVVFALVAWHEELLARGYWLTNLTEGLNRPAAVLLSSSAFALGHISNPNVTWVAIIALLGPGLLFAWAVMRTGRLWLAMGIHFGWNFFEGSIFGFPVSGIATVTLLETAVAGPTLWTGGQFGPEGGLVVLPALLAGALAVGLVTRGRSAARHAGAD